MNHITRKNNYSKVIWKKIKILGKQNIFFSRFKCVFSLLVFFFSFPQIINSRFKQTKQQNIPSS